ncbi:LexA family protein [Streptomyces xanthophaeus]
MYISYENPGTRWIPVVGDSMIEAAICDGDIVTVRRQDSADHDDIAASLGDICGAMQSRVRRCSSVATRRRSVCNRCGAIA